MSEATCKTCPWWHLRYRAGERQFVERDTGECRIVSPSRCPGARFSETGADDWCGEHPSRKAAS